MTTQAAKVKKPAVSALKFLEKELRIHMKWVIRVENVLIKAEIITPRYWPPMRHALYEQARQLFQRSVFEAQKYWGRLEIDAAESVLLRSTSGHPTGSSKRLRHFLPTSEQIDEYRKELAEKKRKPHTQNDRLE